jgi:hypothetical protein
MPLIHSKSNKARQENIKAEIDAGRPIKQAVAIGYSVQKHAKWDDADEARIQRETHEKFKYGK